MRWPAFPSHLGGTRPGVFRVAQYRTEHLANAFWIGAGQNIRAHFTSDGALRAVSERHARNPQDGSFFLDPTAVREHHSRICHEAQEADITHRLQADEIGGNTYLL